MAIAKSTRIAALVCGLSMSHFASALLIDGTATEVGGIDKLINSTFLSDSSVEKQIGWVAGELGFDAADLSVEKIEDMDAKSVNWKVVDNPDGADVKAFKLDEPVYYYLLKLGNINPGKKDKSKEPAPDHFLFDNEDSLDWAVINFSEMFEQLDVTFDLEKISHISQFDTPTTKVPEPGTLGLLSLGLLSVYAIRRRRSIN